MNGDPKSRAIVVRVIFGFFASLSAWGTILSVTHGSVAGTLFCGFLTLGLGVVTCTASNAALEEVGEFLSWLSAFFDEG